MIHAEKAKNSRRFSDLLLFFIHRRLPQLSYASPSGGSSPSAHTGGDEGGCFRCSFPLCVEAGVLGVPLGSLFEGLGSVAAARRRDGGSLPLVCHCEASALTGRGNPFLPLRRLQRILLPLQLPLQSFQSPHLLLVLLQQLPVPSLGLGRHQQRPVVRQLVPLLFLRCLLKSQLHWRLGSWHFCCISHVFTFRLHIFFVRNAFNLDFSFRI